MRASIDRSQLRNDKLPLTPTKQIQEFAPCLRPVRDERRIRPLAILLPLQRHFVLPHVLLDDLGATG